MYLVTSEEMRQIDRYTIDTIGIPVMVLMENAGRAIAEEVVRLAEANAPDDHGLARNGQAVREVGSTPSSRSPRWLVLAGKGNNGGDGIVCARHLAERGYEVLIVYAASPEQLAGEAAAQRDIAQQIGLKSIQYEPGGLDWSSWAGIVDALLGTGTEGAPREPYASLIREANSSGLPIVAVDVPSGLNADTGETVDPCIRASVTVALAMMKRGLLLYPGADSAGEVVVRPIGIPKEAARRFNVNTFLLNDETLRQRFNITLPLTRKADSHKGTYGHVLVAAGSREMSGAGLLCAGAALRAGSGLVSWAVPESLVLPLTGRLPEVMLRGIADAERGDWRETLASQLSACAEGKQAVIIGPGLGRWPGDSAWLRQLWGTIRAPLVIDADALNMLAASGTQPDDGGDPAGVTAPERFAFWPRRNEAAVLTPHPGEMARLCGLPVHEVQRDRIGLARRYAKQHEVTLVLKGARTIVATPHGDVYVNTTGNAGMATGGAGDVLAGIIGGFLAQGMDSARAAALGVYLHGSAGDRAAAARPSLGSLIAGDIVDAL